MAYSCSFSIDGKRKFNQSCFSDFNTRTTSKLVIIIEKEKIDIFGKKLVKEYIKDLQSFLPLEFDKNFNVTLKTNNFFLIKVIYNFIRFLWEGKIEGALNAQFHEVITHYFKIKKYKISDNVLYSLCIAMNCYRANSGNYFYKSHFPISYYSCKLKKELEDYKSDLHSYFNSSYKLPAFSKTPNEKDYKEFYKTIGDELN